MSAAPPQSQGRDSSHADDVGPESIIPDFSRLSTNENQTPPFAWSVKQNNPFLRVRNSTILELTGPFPQELSGEPHVLIRTTTCIPVNQEAYFWELEIMKHQDRDRCVAIGICNESSNMHSLPGLPDSNAYGYHSDDAMIYDMTGAGKHSRRIFGTGDTVGCILDKDGENRRVRFTHNGEKIGQPLILGESMRGQLYPCVGLFAGEESVGTVIQAKFGVEWNSGC